MTLRYSTDIVIFGGGIAGLWLLNKLKNEGYSAILLESHELGGGQTLASQGIIHGGLKYAISGKLSGAADAIAAMPQRWRDCLAGNADIDLRGCHVLSEDYFMWSSSGVRSKLKTFLGSKSLRGRVQSLKLAEYPDFFQSASTQGSLYKLPDFVINTESLLEKLIEPVKESIFSASIEQISFRRDAKGLLSTLVVETENDNIEIHATRTIFAAGGGNQALIDKAELEKPNTQLRPLKMVYMTGTELPQLFVHCIGDSFSLTPTLTVTSHQKFGGNNVWYLGGELAESGVDKTDAAQITAAQELIKALFPWLDLTNIEWNCFSVDRAEPRVSSLSRPDDAFFIEESNVIVTWPTKLTLAPSLGDNLVRHLRELSILPIAGDNEFALSDKLNRPSIATAEWNP